MIEAYDWRAMVTRTLLASIVYITLKPMFERGVLNDQIDLRDTDGLLIKFNKDKTTPIPRLIMETIKCDKSGEAEFRLLESFGMDCGLESASEAVTSMIFERCKCMNKEGEPDDNKNS